MPDLMPDAGPCADCGCGQWQHRQGKRGCKDPECGCGKYTPAKAAQAAVLEVDPASEVPGVLVDGPDGGPEPAQPGDVDLPVDTDPETCCPGEPMPGYDPRGLHSMDCPAYLAMLKRLDAARSEQVVADPEPTDEREHMELNPAGTAEWLKNRVNELTAELEQVRADKIRLTGKLDDARDENRRLREALTRAEGHHATALAALRKTADAYVQTGVAAASRVLYRYDGDQCTTEGCGSRYTVPVEHEHPLTPVTVLVVRREVPGAA